MLRNMAGAPPNRRRRGSVTVEGAVVLIVFLTLMLGTIDLGIAVASYNSLADVARSVARQASVRGVHASPETMEWGPATYQGTAADAHAIAMSSRQSIVMADPGDVLLVVAWPDGDNRLNDRVVVTVAYQYESFLPLAPYSPIPMSSTSTVRVVH